VADTCSHHAPLIIHVMKEYPPASSQAAELLHTIIENTTTTGWIEDIESQVATIMELDGPKEIFTKLFAGTLQFNLKNSLTVMKPEF